MTYQGWARTRTSVVSEPLTTRLAGSGWSVHLLEPSLDMLPSLPLPLLTPLQFEPQRLHMVTILGFHRGFVRIADPEAGVILLSRDEFAKSYSGRVIGCRVAPSIRN